MEILLEPSEYRFLNAGDSAMMQVAMSRLRSMWPEAEIRVLTSHPELLPAYSPRVSPLANTGRLLWLEKTCFRCRLLAGAASCGAGRFTSVGALPRGAELLERAG
jgi:polysaccharide pyruvyl transferase WcaK-like protein